MHCGVYDRLIAVDGPDAIPRRAGDFLRRPYLTVHSAYRVSCCPSKLGGMITRLSLRELQPSICRISQNLPLRTQPEDIHLVALHWSFEGARITLRRVRI